MTTYINTKGEVFDPFKTASAKAPKRPKAKAEPLPTLVDFAGERLGTSKGFAVSGIPPGELPAARNFAVKNGAPFGMPQFLRHAKRKRVARAYEIRSAAEQCADMARKAGWLEVLVEELLKP